MKIIVHVNAGIGSSNPAANYRGYAPCVSAVADEGDPRNEGGEAGHLGGAILGFILVRYPRLLGRGPRIEMFRPKAASPSPLAKLRPRSTTEKEQDSAVDLILDKISREGFQSLTEEERAILHEASKRSS